MTAAETNQIITIVGTLSTVLLTTVLQFLVTQKMDKRRRTELRQDSFIALQRDAITAAFRWIDALRSAQIRASSQSYSLLAANCTHEEFRSGFPAVVKTMSSLELAPEHRLALPGGLYHRGFDIIAKFDELRATTLQVAGRPDEGGMPTATERNSITKICGTIRELIDAFESDLHRAYRATYS